MTALDQPATTPAPDDRAAREPISHAEFARFVQEAREQRARAEAAEAENQALRAALKLYGAHIDINCCEALDPQCACGLDALLAATSLPGAGEG